MKFVIALLGFALAISAQPQETITSDTAIETQPPKQQSFIRDLPADVLRDFQGLCFASTLCRVFEIGENWQLSPFCGRATCILSPHTRRLIERVEDCGPLPKDNPDCTIANANARNETFPTCCPKFECKNGATVQYPTPEELAAAVRSPAPKQ